MTAIAAVALTAAGFIFGWSVSGEPGRGSGEWSQEVASTTAEQTAAPNPSLPQEDVSGTEIDGLPRYPGSVRIEYIREDQGEIVWTETEYLTDATLEETREFYRDVFRSEDWSVNDVGFAQNSWIFFVVDGDREVFVNLRPRGKIVEIDIEHTEPEERTTAQQNTAQQNAAQQNAVPETRNQTGGQSNAAGNADVAAPQVQPEQAVPVYEDDDYYEYDDDDYGDYDD